MDGDAETWRFRLSRQWTRHHRPIAAFYRCRVHGFVLLLLNTPPFADSRHRIAAARIDLNDRHVDVFGIVIVSCRHQFPALLLDRRDGDGR